VRNVSAVQLRNMERIQIVLDKRLLQTTDQTARRLKRTRSAVVRDALREYLRQLHIRELEERDREGYWRRAHQAGESIAWESEASWE